MGASAAGALYVYVTWSAVHGERTLGELVLYGGAATLLYGSLVALATDTGAVAGQFAFLPSLFRVLDAPPDLSTHAQHAEHAQHADTHADAPAGGARDSARAVASGVADPLEGTWSAERRTGRLAPRPLRRGIMFERVSFCYPGRAEPVLRNVSFTLTPSECLALVGQNGAGKTTIVKLLLRFYDPTEGRILVDGVDLRAYDVEDLRREVGVIFQDFVRYELTAGENIGVGRLEALHDRGRLLDAARRAGAQELLQALPQGVDTRLGRLFGGRELSGGEWQKLALARAFLRDSQVLVLDEPTAALDVQTEYDIYRHFQQLTQGHATLLISHRFSTVRMAHRILYLAEGTIQEEGSHVDLIARNGEYARLYRLQAAPYRDTGAIGVSA